MNISDEMVHKALASLLNYHVLSGRIMASQVREALTAALQGSVVVPAEPTPEVISAGDSMMPQIVPSEDEPGLTGDFVAADVYRAMLAAAPSVSRHERGDTTYAPAIDGGNK